MTMTRNFLLAATLLGVLLPSQYLVGGAAAVPNSWSSEELAWRAHRAESLKAPEGWLSLVALDWLNEGDNSFGGAPDNRLPVPGKVPAHIGIVRLDKGTVHLLPPAEGFPKELQIDGHPIDGHPIDAHPAQELILTADDAPTTSKLTVGTLTIIVIYRDDKFGLRIKDLEAPTRTGFHGLHWYAPNASYRVHARWIPYNPPKVINIPTVLGTVTKLPAPGVAEFELAGHTVRLEPVLEDPGDKELFFILRDTTSRKTTYGAGRFLYTDLPDHGLDQSGKIWLDFNRLFNPPCAFTAYATCPLPPPQNRLMIAIPAGEQRYHH